MGKKTYQIQEIGEVVGGGTPSTKIAAYWDGDIAWISPVDLSHYNNVYIEKGKNNITQLGLKKSSTVLLPPNTVLLTSRAPIGYMALAKNSICTNQGFKSIICNPKFVNYRYLYYYLRQSMDYIKLFASGSTFPELSGTRLKRIKITIEQDVTVQKEISSILSAYDDLIENNNKRIKILEQMAENLYKEWFVRFRFPGYETAEFANGIPKGWEIKKLGSLCQIITGKKDVNEAKGEGKYPFFTCSRETNIFTDEYVLDENVILISGNGSYTGFVKKYSGKFDLYQRTYALFGFKNHLWLYLYWAMKINFEREFMGGSRGSAIPYITKPNIEKFEIVVPNENLLFECQNIFERINEICSNLTKQNQNLIKQRDFILPRLMSGKLEVKNAK